MTKSRASVVFAALFFFAAPFGLSACHKKPKEVAPVNAGDWFEYKFAVNLGRGETTYQAKIKIDQEGKDEFKISAEPQGEFPPIVVDAALDNGHVIKIHYLGALWLPPAKRAVGEKIWIGKVREGKKYLTKDVWLVENQGSEYLFDQASGFLIAYTTRISGGSQSAKLINSSIPGIVP